MGLDVRNERCGMGPRTLLKRLRLFIIMRFIGFLLTYLLACVQAICNRSITVAVLKTPNCAAFQSRDSYGAVLDASELPATDPACAAMPPPA